MADYLPHTDEELAVMLDFLGLASSTSCSGRAGGLRLAGGLGLADGMPEPDVLAASRAWPTANRARRDRLVCFAGGGAYDHEVPPVVRALAGRSEFVTSYTPYQPEVAQGVLQAVFEFQTMVARLAGLPVANASLYDGASALVEAVNLGVAAAGRPTVWVSAGVHPHWRAVLATFAAGTGHHLVEVALVDGRTAWPERPRTPVVPPGVVVVGYPNYLGCLEDLGAARRLCRPATGPCWWWRPTRWRPGCCDRRASGGPTWWSGRVRPSGPPSASVAPTSGCSPAPSTRSAGCPAAWSARRSTPRAAGPT